MHERRKHFRVEWNAAAKIYYRHGQFAGTCIVRNFSNGGAKIIGLGQNTVSDEFILRITPHCHAQSCHVVRRMSDGVAVEFTASAKDVADLVRPRGSYAFGLSPYVDSLDHKSCRSQCSTKSRRGRLYMQAL